MTTPTKIDVDALINLIDQDIPVQRAIAASDSDPEIVTRQELQKQLLNILRRAGGECDFSNKNLHQLLALELARRTKKDVATIECIPEVKLRDVFERSSALLPFKDMYIGGVLNSIIIPAMVIASYANSSGANFVNNALVGTAAMTPFLGVELLTVLKARRTERRNAVIGQEIEKLAAVQNSLNAGIFVPKPV